VPRPFEDLNPNTPTPHCDASAGWLGGRNGQVKPRGKNLSEDRR
jgi:hypothetical protein